MAHRGYVTGADARIGEDRTFRLDRIADARTLPGSFEPPAGLDPAQRVLSGLATAPYRLASLDRPFVIERPDELRGLVVALAERLAVWARGG
jgi:hypothetical protein